MIPSNDCAGGIDADGWLTGVARCDSPNRDARPDGADGAIRLIVIHSISLPPGEFGGDAVAELFTNRLDASAHPYFASIAHCRVSAHFFIRRDGATVQFVSCRERAWHAGISCWQGVDRCNDFSLGIELEGDEQTEFTDAQYFALRALLNVLRSHFLIEAVAGHADVAPGRKTDPGRRFDWSRIVLA